MALTVGMGHVDWADGSPGLTLLATILVTTTVVAYWAERRHAPKGATAKIAATKTTSSILGAAAKDESALPLLQKPTKESAATGNTSQYDSYRELATTGLLCAWMLACSVAIIYVNAWILDNLCPHAATLTAIQQCFGAVASAVCVYGLHLSDPVELSYRSYLTYVVPLAAAFTGYLWGSNAAYIYLAPGFIQMVKPLGSAIVFVVATLLRLEKYTHAKFANFLLLCSGVALTALAKFDGTVSSSSSSDSDSSGTAAAAAVSRRHVALGLAVLVGAYAVVALYNVGLQLLQTKGVLETKFNPLTSLLYIAPATCVFMTAFALTSEWSRPNFHCFDALPWWLLLLDCLVAFFFNLSMMLFIGKLSAVAYSVFAFVKEIVLVLVACLFFSETVSRTQLEGYLVTTVAVLVWQHRKITSSSSNTLSGNNNNNNSQTSTR